MKLSSRDGAAFSLAIEFVSAILVGAGGGYALDRWLHTSPWCLLGGLGLGAAGSFLALLRFARPGPDAGSKSDAPDPKDTDAGH